MNTICSPESKVCEHTKVNTLNHVETSDILFAGTSSDQLFKGEIFKVIIFEWITLICLILMIIIQYICLSFHIRLKMRLC